MGDRRTFDKLHHEVRQPVIRCTRVQKPRDVRVLKLSQDLSLDSKTTQHFIGVCTPFKYFDRYALLKLSIGSLGEVNSSHTPTPKLFDDHIRADSFTDAIASVMPTAPRCEFRQFFANGRIVDQQLFSFKKKCCVTGARLGQHSC